MFLNQEDIAAAGLHARQVVDLVSHFEGEERIARRFVVVPYDIPRRCAATYFPEANVLVPVRSVAAEEQHAGVEVGGDQHPACNGGIKANMNSRTAKKKPARKGTAAKKTSKKKATKLRANVAGNKP